ncbi:MAG TPA: CehA/McbA family metallohydrolase [Roseiflexaceae bacterium]|nr:CehA/McbA family metallohydrolase [Roseiflexaceae bacterium]
MQTIEFGGTLTERHVKQHIEHRFMVEPGATALRISFRYAPGRVSERLNALHLSLFDPNGFRGARHRPGQPQGDGLGHTVTIDADEATPGYLPGPIPAGEWCIVIDTHMIMPSVAVSYHITIEVDDRPVARQAAAAMPSGAIAVRGAGWYRGDLHGHSVHSDASLQIAELVAAARRFKLDFVTLSDHNTISGLAEFERLAAPDVCPIAGQELTTYWGHALALGLRDWVDWRVRSGVRSMPDIAREVEAAGGLFVIAHPMSVGDPVCTGCDWRYRDMMPGPAPCVEIWNGGRWSGESNNEHALALWYAWLNAGHRLVGTAGTDVHGVPPNDISPGFNHVYAEACSAAAILQAVRQGHLFVSDGPHLELQATGSDGTQVMMGDTLACASGALRASWQHDGSEATIYLIGNGQKLLSEPADRAGECVWAIQPDQARWYTVELRDHQGRLRAVTNPIWLRSN